MNDEEARQLLLRYLAHHPEAGDTMEGIIRWWFMREKIESDIAMLTGIVQKLVNEGYLIEKGGRGAAYYVVNSSRIGEIKTLIRNGRAE